MAGTLRLSRRTRTHHVKNSTEFVQVRCYLLAGPEDTMVRFHVASLFTRVPIRKTVSLVGGHPSTGPTADRSDGRFLQ